MLQDPNIIYTYVHFHLICRGPHSIYWNMNLKFEVVCSCSCITLHFLLMIEVEVSIFLLFQSNDDMVLHNLVLLISLRTDGYMHGCSEINTGYCHFPRIITIISFLNVTMKSFIRTKPENVWNFLPNILSFMRNHLFHNFHAIYYISAWSFTLIFQSF